jgi:hypothetical protein
MSALFNHGIRGCCEFCCELLERRKENATLLDLHGTFGVWIAPTDSTISYPALMLLIYRHK